MASGKRKIIAVINEVNDEKQEKKVSVPRSAAEIQRFKLEKLQKKPDKPAFIPEKKDPKLPRVFNPPEFIRNIWGSSAGAGSGDFHVYRGVRRREYARQKYLNQKYKKDELDEEFQQRLVEHKQAAVSRTAKKRAKRLKKKQKATEAKKKKVAAKPNAKMIDDGGDDSEDDVNSSQDSCDDDQPAAAAERTDVTVDAIVDASQAVMDSGHPSADTQPADSDSQRADTRH